jgi:hypothetical protein
MEHVELYRYQTTGLVGAGADYEVRAAIELQTGRHVVLKRPVPQMIRRHLHAGIEARTERTLQVYREVSASIPTLIGIVGYTERANHDAYFGDALGQPYRVIVEEHAVGIPLVADLKARFTGIPIGVGQNLFALFPLVQPQHAPPFAIQQQLLDLQEAFGRAGYVILDLRPQNVFYQPASGRITVVDCGALVAIGAASPHPGRPVPDIHDFYLEMLKFYTTSQQPPLQAHAYRDPHDIGPIVSFTGELDRMARGFQAVPERLLQETALILISQVRQRAYVASADFRRDLGAYLHAAANAHQALPNLAAAQQAWRAALAWLRADYWRRYRFHAETELAAFES